MSRGTWNENEGKTRPGMYNRFIGVANSRISSGPRGFVGIPVKADWGPIGEMVELSTQKDILETFGTGGTAYLLERILCAGKRYKPSKIKAYRMASASAKEAVAAVADCIKFTAKYKGARGNAFSVTIAESLTDGTQKEVKIYENEKLIAAYTAAPDAVAELAERINSDEASLITAQKIGEEPLADTANIALSGGDSGQTVTAEQYLKAMEAFEPVMINVFVLDGVTDSDILVSAKGWVKRVRENGKEVMLVMGGSAEEDKDPDTSNKRSKDADHEAVINVITGVISGGKEFTSAETACQVAGLIAGTPLNQSVTFKELENVDGVTVLLSNEQIGDALKSGSLVLVQDVDPETGAVAVKVEQGLNTLTSYSENQNELFSKIRVIRTLDAIDYDTGRWADLNIIGELNNNADGQAALISGIKLYLETLAAQGAISDDFLVGVDENFTSTGDTVYLSTQALPLDSIEKIFNTIYLQ